MDGNAHKKRLAVFDIRQQRCNELHKNALSSRMQELETIDSSIFHF